VRGGPNATAINPCDSSRGRLHARAQATRRQFLLLMGTLGAIGAALFGGIEVLKFVFPNTTAEALLLFKPSVHPSEVTIDNPHMDYAHRTGIILDDAGFYAVELVCTRVGCTPNYVTNVTQGGGWPDKHGVRKPVSEPSSSMTTGTCASLSSCAAQYRRQPATSS
jgi:hypothetical protein